ncbi:hypothetical protein FA95DRAFT_1604499 [Auriscalpium vulgare]|uniref:Uncharacterized protein n=1 Tax=Auriscalpium vulgare TaxID=40419 RepID=A0ACB8S0K2_9AGAM|nr:hypothetical protein FA95DRAFT_1604499 [Auriscalpium vulgare]
MPPTVTENNDTSPQSAQDALCSLQADIIRAIVLEELEKTQPIYLGRVSNELNVLKTAMSSDAWFQRQELQTSVISSVGEEIAARIAGVLEAVDRKVIQLDMTIRTLASQKVASATEDLRSQLMDKITNLDKRINSQQEVSQRLESMEKGLAADKERTASLDRRLASTERQLAATERAQQEAQVAWGKERDGLVQEQTSLRERLSDAKAELGKRERESQEAHRLSEKISSRVSRCEGEALGLGRGLADLKVTMADAVRRLGKVETALRGGRRPPPTGTDNAAKKTERTIKDLTARVEKFETDARVKASVFEEKLVDMQSTVEDTDDALKTTTGRLRSMEADMATKDEFRKFVRLQKEFENSQAKDMENLTFRMNDISKQLSAMNIKIQQAEARWGAGESGGPRPSTGPGNGGRQDDSQHGQQRRDGSERTWDRARSGGAQQDGAGPGSDSHQGGRQQGARGGQPPRHGPHTDPEAKMHDDYNRTWTIIDTVCKKMKSGESVSFEPLTFKTMPWPCPSRPMTTADLTEKAISAFVFSQKPTADACTDKQKVNEALRRWHPDKNDIIRDYCVAPGERKVVKEGVDIVTRILTDIRNTLG